MPGMDEELKVKYDPTHAMKTVEKIKKERAAMMEGTLTNRNISVFNFGNANPQALKRMLAEIDQASGGGGVRLGSSNEPMAAIPEDGQIDTNPAQVKKPKETISTGGGSSISDVMKLHKDLKKHSEFQNKRSQELERVMNTPVHTRATIRVKFPDGYLL